MDYEVSFPELRAAGEEFGTMQSTGTQLLGELRSVPLSQPDFGRIPWLQTRVWEAFSQHTQDCSDALEELSETLGTIHEGLGASADAYESVEESAEQACTDFFDQVG